MGRAAGFAYRRQRIDHQFFDLDLLVHQAVDEGTVRAVFQQPPHQIRQQGFMPADRGVNPAASARPVAAHHVIVERFTHAVQALEFVVGDV